MSYPCPACHAEKYPHRIECALTTCHYCGASLLSGGSIMPPETRAGELVCAYCALRLPRCEVCFGTGMTLAGDRQTIVTGDPCSECHGDGFVMPDDGCPYSGHRYCDDRRCPDCAKRASIAAEDRTEQRAKDQDYAREWGMRP